MKSRIGAIIATAVLATPLAAQQRIPLDLRKCERTELNDSTIAYNCYITSEAARGSFIGKHYSIITGYTGPDSAYASTVRDFASRARNATTFQARAKFANTYRIAGDKFAEAIFCSTQFIGDGVHFLPDSTQERFSSRVVACRYQAAQQCTADKKRRVCTETPIRVPRTYIDSIGKQ